MYFAKFFALAGLLAGVALAAPNAEPNNPPPKPNKPSPPPTPPQQSNACGNDAQPYCCTSDGLQTYTSCYAFQFSSQCSQTTVCCNANNSVQVCVGNAEIVTPPYYAH